MNSEDRSQNESASGDEALSAYLDGELRGEHLRALELRLEQEPQLREALNELRSLSAMMQKLPKEKLSKSFPDTVLRRAEREMLIGERSFATADGTAERQAAVADTPAVSPKRAPHPMRKFWWVPAAMAALLAGVLLLPSVVDRTNVAKSGLKTESHAADAAAEPETVRARESAAINLEVATEADSLEMEESPAVAPAEIPATDSSLPAREAGGSLDTGSDAPAFDNEETDDAPMANRMAMRAEPNEPAADSILGGETTEAAAGDSQPLGNLEPTAPESSGGGAGYGGGRGGRSEAGLVWDYQEDVPLVEVQLPSLVLDSMGKPIQKSAAVQLAPEIEAGQLYAVEGSPEDLQILLAELQQGGATIHEHDVPVELKNQLLSQASQTNRWFARSALRQNQSGQDQSDQSQNDQDAFGQTEGRQFQGRGRQQSAAASPLEGQDVVAQQNMQQLATVQEYLDDPRQQIRVLEANDSNELAQVAMRNVIHPQRKKKATGWIQEIESQNAPSNAALAATDAERDAERNKDDAGIDEEDKQAGEELFAQQRPMTSLEFRQRLNEQLTRRLGEADGAESKSALAKKEAVKLKAATNRAQIYLWLRVPNPMQQSSGLNLNQEKEG